MPIIRFLVVWGLDVVIATLVPNTRFMSVDLPTFGLPKRVTNPLFFWILIFSFFISCQSSKPKHNFEDFNKAETFYRQGIYESALDYYELFISANPESPLTEIAKLRIRTIRREVASMLENPKLRTAKYHGRKRAETEKALRILIESEKKSAP